MYLTTLLLADRIHWSSWSSGLQYHFYNTQPTAVDSTTVISQQYHHRHPSQPMQSTGTARDHPLTAP